MTARAEIEEMLEQRAWAERAGVDYEPVYLPPATMLRDHEHRTYRDCPPDDCNDTLPVIPLGWVLLASLAITVFGAITVAYFGTKLFAHH